MEEDVQKREEQIAQRQEEEKRKQLEREEEEKAKREAEKAKREAEVKREDKRIKIVHELLQVEKNYVHVLHLIIGKYLNPLQASAKSVRPILNLDQIKNIFSIVEILNNYHKLLFESLESRIKRWLADQMRHPLNIGDIFIRAADTLRCYTAYINNFNNAIATVRDCRKTNPAFSQFLKRVQADPETRMEDLDSFLIAPVQQLPRYIMLLTDLLRNTSSTHDDFGTLTQAVNKMKDLTIYVNEQKRVSEDAATVAAKQALIRGKCPNLSAPQRKFVRDGNLNFGENQTVKTKDGYVFLFNDVVVLTEKVANKSEYTFKDLLTLSHFRIEDDTRPGRNSFFLKGQKTHIFDAATPTEKNVWRDAVKKALEGGIKK